MNTNPIIRALEELSQIKLVGEKLNESLKKIQQKTFASKQKSLNAKIKRSYPKPP